MNSLYIIVLGWFIKVTDHKRSCSALKSTSCIEQYYLTFYVYLATCRFVTKGDVFTTVRINFMLTQDQCLYSHTHFSILIIIGGFFHEFLSLRQLKR
jgi:hypothetical protein